MVDLNLEKLAAAATAQMESSARLAREMGMTEEQVVQTFLALAKRTPAGLGEEAEQRVRDIIARVYAEK